MKYGDEALLRGIQLEREQGTELRVAILLDDEYPRVIVDETLHVVTEGERPQPHVVDEDSLGGQQRERFTDGAVAAAERDDSPGRALVRGQRDRGRHERSRRLELAQEPIHALLILVRSLRVACGLVVPRAAREVARPSDAHRDRCGSRFRRRPCPGNAGSCGSASSCFRVEHLAAVRPEVVVPLELPAHPVVHADIQVGHDDDRRLQPLGEIERGDREIGSTPPDSAGNSSTWRVSPWDA